MHAPILPAVSGPRLSPLRPEYMIVKIRCVYRISVPLSMYVTPLYPCLLCLHVLMLSSLFSIAIITLNNPCQPGTKSSGKNKRFKSTLRGAVPCLRRSSNTTLIHTAFNFLLLACVQREDGPGAAEPGMGAIVVEMVGPGASS